MDSAAAGTAYIAPDDRILMVRRASGDHLGTWAFPGGGIETGESPDACARREAREELGVAWPEPGGRWMMHRHVFDGTDFTTYGAHVTGHHEPELNHEHDAFLWAHPSALPEPLHPGVRKVVSDCFAKDITASAIASMPDLSDAHRASVTGDNYALDYQSVRDYDRDGRLHVTTTNISKANICSYRGCEIPNWREMGLDADRTYRLLRDPDELKKAAKTFNNLPLLVRHVPVNAEDHRPDLTVGSTGTDAAFDGTYLKNSLVVWAKDSISAIENGAQKELSCGYRYRADMTPGVYKGEPYDGVMRDIIGNHVALVQRGRAGPDVVVGDEEMDQAHDADLAELTQFLRALGQVDGNGEGGGDPNLNTRKIDAVPSEKDADGNPLEAGGNPLETGGEPGAGEEAGAGEGQEDGQLKEQIISFLSDKLGGNDLQQVEAIFENHINSKQPSMSGGEEGGKKPPFAKGGEEAGEEGNSPPDKEAKKDQPMEEKSPKDADGGDAPEFSGKRKQAGESSSGDDRKDDTAMDAQKTVALDSAEFAEAVRAEAEKAAKIATDAAVKNQQEIREAERAVRPYVGDLSMSFDSAEQVYRTALTSLGIKHEEVHASALPVILSMAPLPHAKRDAKPMAQDSAAASSFMERYPQAGKISVM